ncbi:hypothetical protein WMY93_021131 [Mugilogobius chulae]|uniref:[histone H3]-lysine(4) N-trimethyltransferase n=1 Tax=Mugilogobius chulae TaxID=88201 RepID=A0AAW0NE29_9GOBI
MTGGGMENTQLFDAGGKGRGLRATKELSAGDVVFSEPGFAAVVYDSMAANVCHNCFRRQSKLHRCASAGLPTTGDRTCQTACWEEHKLECAAIRNIVTAPNEQVRRDATDAQLVAVDKLEDHVADLGEADLKQLNANVSSFFQFWSYGSKQHSADYISHIFGIVKSNGLALSDQRGLQAVGVGLFPNLCLVNHDCWPNCTVILNNGNQSALNSALHSKRRIELRALGKISEGQELTISYVDFLNLSADRQKKLKELHFFDCTCEHCTQHIKDDLMTLLQRAKKLYHPNNAQLGLAIMKAGVTHWHAGQIEQGHGFICKAYSILMITHGPNHAITKDLESMRAQTEIELKMFRQNEKEYHTMRQEVLKDSAADKKI